MNGKILCTFSSAAKGIQLDCAIKNEKGKTVGKLRGLHGEVGLGLMRLQESLAASSLTMEGLEVAVGQPAWWPKETSAGGQRRQ